MMQMQLKTTFLQRVNMDLQFMEQTFEHFKPDRVIHVATYPNARMVKRNVLDATNNMITATAYILDLCVKHKVDKTYYLYQDVREQYRVNSSYEYPELSRIRENGLLILFSYPFSKFIRLEYGFNINYNEQTIITPREEWFEDDIITVYPDDLENGDNLLIVKSLEDADSDN